ncbi:ATP-binding protein [Acholeplasma equirhinis]|uniref:ATP-binding protein n=1 Tax=Acholeplasma equirhinis TaxID=555393 RepID=UPI00197AF1D0|nr:ATP-binding protein [Acholeplasma equirhinis]MBN3489920.1 ATP-binding protein [Acholeplasma equirhinis]
MAKYIENLPNAATLISSMRHIGYDFETAIADIIDNSISANAKKVDLFYPVNKNEKLYLTIIDDGNGMNKAELIEAMRFGSIKEQERKPDDLGRFGLGLKTASLSQCKKMTVVSKSNDGINGYTWDLDVIIKSKKWDLQELEIDEILRLPNLSKYLDLVSFTYVYWDNFDTLEKDITIFEQDIHDVFTKKIASLDKHLSLVFHRYLEENLEISINKRSITPVDPFLKSHPKTIMKDEVLIQTATSSGEKEIVKMQAFVLPYHKYLMEKDYEKLGGKDEIDSQGFYIYRNRRLMIHGTWFRIKPKAELSRNARIRVDIPNTLDDIWSIDIKKQQAVIPGKLLNSLKKEISEAIEKSKRIYEYKGTVETKKGSVWNKRANLRDDQAFYEIDRNSPILKKYIDRMDERFIQELDKIFSIIELSIPYNDIYNSVANKKEINQANDNDLDLIISQAYQWALELKGTTKDSIHQVIDEICSYEPFASSNIKGKLLEKFNG